jgi:glucokinase
MDYLLDQRIVLTLDAGGTNFVFSAIQSGKEISKPFSKPIKALNLEQILKTIIDGFNDLNIETGHQAVAISFSFPGPTDYKNGIIGDLQNLPQFRGGVALKAMLENKFNIPVFINNDGDLFAYGEAIAGFLPEVNKLLSETNSSRVYHNLLGVTLGSGYGSGIISKNELFIGDNSSAAEINRMRNKLHPFTSAEDSLTIKAIKRIYGEESNLKTPEVPEPEAIFKIGMGEIPGNKKAALKAFEELAIVSGDTLANAESMVDGLIVIGGGLSGAHPLFLQQLVDEMNTKFDSLAGDKLCRMEVIAYNLESPEGFKDFIENTEIKIKIPFTEKYQNYEPIKKIGVGISKLGTSKATSIGAYAYALNQINNKI